MSQVSHLSQILNIIRLYRIVRLYGGYVKNNCYVGWIYFCKYAKHKYSVIVHR